MTTYSNPTNLTLSLADESATESLAEQFANIISHYISNAYDESKQLSPGGRIYLRGDLGAGKTCFTRALLRALGVTGRIKSPSYTLLESYKVSRLYLYHFDFYRFNDPDEWRDAGFKDQLLEEALVIVEWPEKAGVDLPVADIDLNILYEDHGRTAVITAQTSKGQSWIRKLRS